MDAIKKEKIEMARRLLESFNLADDATTNLFHGLDLLKSIQAITSDLTPNCIPQIGDEPTKDQIRTYALAMMIEMGEFVQELNWKPWKKDKPLNEERIIDEFADILAFMGILLVYLDRLGISMQDLAEGYIKKTNVNVSRFLGEVPEYAIHEKV